MRSAGFALPSLVIFLVFTPGCEKDKPRESLPPVVEPASPEKAAPGAAQQPVQPRAPTSSISMADAEASHQLVEGFYSIEESAWRWTAKRFTVDLAAPPTAKEKGATLRFKLTLPEAAFKEYKSVAVSAKLDGLDIPAKKFAKVGDHEFVAEIPATSLQSDKVRVEFSLDKSFLPGSGDQRELGIVARHIGLEPKELGLTTK